MLSQLVPSREGGSAGAQNASRRRLIPQQHRQPAGTELTRTPQAHGAKTDRHHIAVKRRRQTILREQRDLLRFSGVFVEDLDRLAPRRLLAVIDLAEIKHLALNDAAVVHAPVFHHRPRAMLLAVLTANLSAQKHDA